MAMPDGTQPRPGGWNRIQPVELFEPTIPEAVLAR